MALNRKNFFRRGAINMRAMKGTVSVLLTLVLVLGMVTIGIGAVSAAETKKINITSNIGVSSSKEYDATSQMVSVTFNLKSANVFAVRGVVTFDPAVLSLADTTVANIFPVLKTGQIVANTGKSDGRLPFNSYNLNGFDFDDSGVLATITFNILKCEADTTVNLEVIDLIGSTVLPNTDSSQEVTYIEENGVNDTTAYTATVTEQVTPPVEPFIQSETLALEGKIGVNFYFYNSPSGYTASNIKVKFSGPGTDYNKTVKLTSLPSGQRGGVTVRRYTYFVAPSDMTDTITLQFYNGSTIVSTSTTSVAEWLDNNVGKYETSNPQAATLMKTMLNYGAAAQVIFDHNTDNLANKNSNYALVKITADQITVPSGLNGTPLISRCGLQFDKSTVGLEAGTDLRLRCKVTNLEAANNAYVTCNGQTIYFTGTDTVKIATLSDIAAPYLDTVYTFKFSNGSQYKQSAMNFFKDYLQKNSSNEVVVNLVSSVYWYNLAANDFFGE